MSEFTIPPRHGKTARQAAMSANFGYPPRKGYVFQSHNFDQQEARVTAAFRRGIEIHLEIERKMKASDGAWQRYRLRSMLADALGWRQEFLLAGDVLHTDKEDRP